jgi:hypothetical protein
MAVYAKALVHTVDQAGGIDGTSTPLVTTTNIQPASGKMWWFKTMRYSALLRKVGTDVATLNITTVVPGGSEVPEISLAGDNFPGVSTETVAASVVTNTQHLRFVSTTTGGASNNYVRAAFRWFGIEVDV